MERIRANNMTVISNSVGTTKSKRFSTYCRIAHLLSARLPRAYGYVSTALGPYHPLGAMIHPAKLAGQLRCAALAPHQAPAPQARIEQIPQGIAQHVEAKHGQTDSHTRPGGHPGGLVHVGAS